MSDDFEELRSFINHEFLVAGPDGKPMVRTWSPGRLNAALDRIEAVVNAARAVQHGANIRVLYRALAALDSQEEGTP